mgnify:CR=1 FL=1
MSKYLILRYGFFVFFGSIFLLSIPSVYAEEDCIEFDDWELCVDVDIDNDNVDIQSFLQNNRTADVFCNVKTPENIWATVYYLSSCDWTFDFNNNGRWFLAFKIYVDNELATAKYDIDNNLRDVINEPGNRTSDDEDEYEVDIDIDTRVEEDEDLDIDIRVEEDRQIARRYDSTMEVDIEYWDGSRWEDAPRSYYEIDWRDELDIRNGRGNENNWIRFERERYYKIIVEDENDRDIRWEEIIEVWNVSRFYEYDRSDDYNRDNDYWSPERIQIKADSLHNTNSYIDIEVRILDDDWDVVQDFDDDLNIRVLYNDSENTFNRRDEIDKNDFDNWVLIDFWSSYDDGSFSFDQDNGSDYVEIDNFVRFRRDWYYQIELYMDDNSSVDGVKTFIVWDPNDESVLDTDYYAFQTSIRDVVPDEYVDINIQARLWNNEVDDNYWEYVNIRVWYDQNNKIFSSIDEIDEQDFDDTNLFVMDDQFEDWRFYMRHWSDYDDLTDFISFSQEWYYKIWFYEEGNSDIEWSIVFDVDDSHDATSSSFDWNNDEFLEILWIRGDWSSIDKALDIVVLHFADGEINKNYESMLSFFVYKKFNWNFQNISWDDQYYFIKDNVVDMSSDWIQISRITLLDDRIYFKEDWEYKIEVYDATNTRLWGDKIFTID